MVTLTKNGETVQVPLSEARGRLQQGWTVVEATIVQTNPANSRVRTLTLTGDVAADALRSGQFRGRPFSIEGEATREIQERSQQEIADIQDANAFGGLGVLGIEAADALTFGGATALGDVIQPGFRERRENAAEQFPGESQLGRIVGTGVGLFTGTGAAGVAVRAGRAIRGAREGASLGRFLFAGAAEGAIGAAGEAVTDAVIDGNADGLAERVMMDAAFGAVFGLAFDGGLTAMGRGATAFSRSREMVSHLDEAGHAVNRQGFINRLRQAVSGQAEDVNVAQIVDDVDVILSNRQAAFRELESGIESAFDAGRQVLRDIDPLEVAKRPGQALFREGGLDRLRNASRSLVDGLDTVEGLSRLSDRQVSQIRSLQERARRVAAEGEGDLGTLSIRNRSIENLQNLQREADELARSLPSDRGIEVQDLLSKFSRDLDGSIAPEIAEARRLSNEIGRVLDSNGISQADGSANVSGIVKAIRESVENGGSERLDQLNDLIKNIDSANQSGLFRGQTQSLDDLKLSLRRLRSFARYKQEIVTANQASAAGSQAAGVVGAIVGGALGGGAGAGVGAGIGQMIAADLRSPLAAALQRKRLRRLVLGQNARVSRAMDDAVEMATSPSRVTRGMTLSKLRVPRGTIAHALINGDKDEKRELYVDMAERIDQLAMDPEAFAASVNPHIQGAANFGEDLPYKLSFNYHNALQAMSAALPTNSRGSRRNMMGQIIPPSAGEIDDFLITAAAIEDPITGFEMAMVGGLTPTAARALARVYPQAHTEITNEFIRRVVQQATESPRTRRRRQQREALTGAINYQMLTRMSNFAQMPLDETLDSEFVSIMQSQFAQTPAQERAQFGNPQATRLSGGVATSQLTPTQRIEQ